MADREHIVRYVAVLDASNFFKQMQAMKKRLEAVNKSAVGSDDFQNKIDSQTASLREQGKAADVAAKSNKNYSGVLKEVGKNLASVRKAQREATAETAKHARVTKSASRELIQDQKKLATEQETQFQRGLGYLQNYAFRRRQILNTVVEDQQSASAKLKTSASEINRDSKFTANLGGSSGNGNKIAKNVGFLGGLAKSLVLLKGIGIYAIAVSLQSLISAVAAAGGAVVVFANAIAQLSSVAGSVPGLIAAIGTAAISVKTALSGIGEAFKLFGNENNKAPTTYAEALEKW